MDNNHDICRSCGGITIKKYAAWGVLIVETVYRLCLCSPSFASETMKEKEEPIPGVAQLINPGTGDGLRVLERDYAHYERDVQGMTQTPVAPAIHENLIKKGVAAEIFEAKTASPKFIINGKIFTISTV